MNGIAAIDVRQCTGEWSEPPENGHFIRVDISGETAPGETYEADGGAFDVWLNNGWTVIADNGTTFNGNPTTAAAYSCLADGERLPDMIGPGQGVSGAVVLDVPTASGVIVFRDPAAGAGWEWSYPAS